MTLPKWLLKTAGPIAVTAFNMDRVVHNGEHNIDTGDDVAGDVPKVKKINNVCEGNDDNTHDVHAYLEVS